jgi:hypothetical protein
VKTRKTRMVAVMLAAGLSGPTQATLLGRDLNGSIDSFEAYYDTDLNITWLADANYGAGSSYDDIAGSSYDGVGSISYTTTDGRMSWGNAMAWVANLSFTDGVSVYDNWRLPITPRPDAVCGEPFGFGCAGSDMGHLFYSELGGTAGQSILTSADPDLAKFSNIKDYRYWSGSEYLYVNSAMVFNMFDGYQSWDPKTDGLYAWAVSDGDVGVAAAPEPATCALMLAGLAMLGLMARRSRG